jgi:hypothetical protein
VSRPGRPWQRPLSAAAVFRGLAWSILVGSVATFAVAVPIRAGHPGQLVWLDIGVYALVYLSAAGLLLGQQAADRRARWGWRSV